MVSGGSSLDWVERWLLPHLVVVQLLQALVILATDQLAAFAASLDCWCLSELPGGNLADSARDLSLLMTEVAVEVDGVVVDASARDAGY